MWRTMHDGLLCYKCGATGSELAVQPILKPSLDGHMLRVIDEQSNTKQQLGWSENQQVGNSHDIWLHPEIELVKTMG